MTGARPLGALLLALLAACGDADDGPRPPAHGLTRLWRDALPARTRSPAATPATDARLLFEARFDGSQAWWEGRIVGGEAVVFEPAPPAGEALELRAGHSMGRTHALPVAPGTALHVTLRARPVAPRPQPVELDLGALVERDVPFDPGASHAMQDVAALLDPRRGRARALRAEVSDEPVQVEARFVVGADTRELQLVLLAPMHHPQRRMLVESLRVEQVPLAEHLAAGGGLPGLERLEHGVAWTLDRDRREGLLLAPGEALAWTLPAAPRARRLELAWGLPPWGAGSAGVRARITSTPAGGAPQVLLDETLAPPASPAEPAWRERRVELPPSPDGAARLEVRVEPLDARAPCVLLGHPVLWRGGAPERPNVLLVSLDTVRPDRLGSYGGDPRVSPRLDALAAEGLRFSQASSTSSYTLPSHGSMLTGQYPAEHGAVDIDDRLDPEHSPLLAALLAEHGWITAGFTGGGYVAPRYGFAHGFDRYSVNDPVWPHDTLRGDILLAKLGVERSPVPEALMRRYGPASIVDWIGARPGGPPFFAFVHTYIAHNFAPGAEWLERFDLLVGPEGREEPFDHKAREAFNKGEHALLEEVRAGYLPYYDATLAMADDFVGTLLDALERHGLDEDTLVIVTSDHGEEFGEHGFFGHGETLYNANTRVPLVVRLPGPRGAREGGVIDAPVSLADLPPWILQVLGLPPQPRMAGATDLARLAVAPPRRDGLLIELDNRRYRKSALRAGPLKLHLDLEVDREPLEPPRVRLYDVEADPGETRDLAAERPVDVARLRERLDALHALTETIRPRDGAVDHGSLTLEQLQQLEALGYLSAEEVRALLDDGQ